MTKVNGTFYDLSYTLIREYKMLYFSVVDFYIFIFVQQVLGDIAVFSE